MGIVRQQLSCCSAATSTLRWAMTRTAVPGSAKLHRNGESKNKERSIDIKKILKVETGTGMFPGSSGTKGALPSSMSNEFQSVLALLLKSTVLEMLWLLVRFCYQWLLGRLPNQQCSTRHCPCHLFYNRCLS